LRIFTFDARGNGGGGIACTITGDHQTRISDYTAIAVIEYDDMEREDGRCGRWRKELLHNRPTRKPTN